ncbi:MAG: hypothetical protein AMXMBFR84_09310 [Candidatus Hydrogenedentota bacterium]
MDTDVVSRIGERRYRLIKLWVNDVNGAFDALYAGAIGPATSVLDAGASRGDPDLPSIHHGAMSVACDADELGLRGNSLFRHRVLNVLNALPFRNEAFDVIVCKFVVEHLTDPVAVFREFCRVLRPGGVVAILTPNKNSLFAVIARLWPYRLKQLFKRFLFGGHDEDTFPAHYRANTPSAITGAMHAAGFQRQRLDMIGGMWAFFIFNGPLALAVRALERVQMRTPLLRGTCTHMMGLWTKPAPAA